MNIYLLILLILTIIIFSNLAMFGLVRGSRGMKFDWFNGTKNNLSQPFKKEDDQLGELRKNVEKLSQEDERSQEPENRRTE